MNSVSLNKLLALTALLCSVLSAVMASRDLSGLYIIIFLFAVTAGFIVELKGFASPPRMAINICAITLLVVILFRIRRNYLVEPFMELVLMMTAVKTLERKFARDYMQMLLLNLMMLICYAMVSMDMKFILYCFGEGLVWSLIMTLCSWQKKDYHAAVPLKVLSRLFSRLIFMFLLMLPFCLLMFIVAPRVRSPFLAVYGSTPEVGFSEQVNLGTTSEIQKNDKLAFRAETQRQPFSPYWRGITLDLFNGRAWFSAPRSPRSRYAFTGGGAVEQEIYLEPGRRRYLFALDVPVSVSKVRSRITGDGSIIYGGVNDGRRLQYTAFSVPSDVMPMTSANFNKGRYLNLPDNFIPALRNEVERITEGLSLYQKIRAIMSYLSPPNFQYTLTDMPKTSNALEHFLFVSKKGNCEFFASAMGVMLRMANIPSRLVGGYKGGVYNDAGGYYAVFEESAHVWVELWDEERASWVRYDPTPYSPAGGASAETYELWESYLDLLDYQWTKFVLNYNLEMQGELITSIKGAISNPKASDFTEFFEIAPIIAGIAGVTALVIYLIRRASAKNEGETLPRKFTDIMRKKGFHRHKSEGLREFARSLPPRERNRAMPFVERFEEYYYKEKEFDAPAVKFLREQLRALKTKD